MHFRESFTLHGRHTHTHKVKKCFQFSHPKVTLTHLNQGCRFFAEHLDFVQCTRLRPSFATLDYFGFSINLLLLFIF